MKIHIVYMDGGIVQLSWGLNNSVNIERNLLPKICGWCKENIPESKIGDLGYTIEHNTYYVYINTNSAEDLMAFKLMWS